MSVSAHLTELKKKHETLGREVLEFVDVAHEVAEALHGLRRPAVDVDRVAERLEGVERDPDGDDPPRQAPFRVRPEQPSERGRVLDGERAVLEEAEEV